MLTWQPNTLEPALIPGVTLDQGSRYERKVSDSERNTDTHSSDHCLHIQWDMTSLQQLIFLLALHTERDNYTNRKNRDKCTLRSSTVTSVRRLLISYNVGE